MGKFRDFLVYTNPITIIGALATIPVVLGISIACMFDGTIRKTKQVIKDIDVEL